MKRVVVTGLGTVNPLGLSVDEFWKNLIEGTSGAGPITRFDTSNFKTRFACEVKGFDPLKYVEKKEANRLDLFTLFAFAAADECFSDSGLKIDSSNSNRVGVVWGSGMGGMITYEKEMFDFFQNNQIPRFGPFFIPKLIPNITSGQLTIRYGLNGPSYSITSACASSNNALCDAFNLIRLGMCDAILTGGSEAPICMGPVAGFNAMRAISEKNDLPTLASRPFDKDRDGFVLGEGSGAMMIESMEHAINRGAKIYCEIKGIGLASDAYHITAPHPEGIGAVLAMKQAIDMAGLSINDIDYINAHATSTPLGDISECKAIEKLFNQSLEKIQISATKSMTGHLMGAAGIVEAIATTLTIQNNIVPPTINLQETDLQIDNRLNLTPQNAIKKEVFAALNNTFGFGGHIACTLFTDFR